MKKECNGLKIVTYSSSELSKLSEEILRAIARCYAGVFKESWQESWTEELAMEEVCKALVQEEGREPLATIIWDGDSAVGFGWGLLTDVDHLIAERDMPFALPLELKQEGLEKAKLWLTKVAKTPRVFLYREFGCLSAYKGRMAPHLTLEILRRVESRGIKVLLFWTSIESRVFELGVGLKWTPIHFFTPAFEGKNLLVMAGNVKYTADFIEIGLTNPQTVDEHYMEVARNIETYCCA